MMPKIIQLCDGIMASGLDPITHGNLYYTPPQTETQEIQALTISNWFINEAIYVERNKKAES